MRNALASWPLAEVRAFFESDLGIALELEPSGKLFPRSNDPREVVAALLGAARAAGAELVGGTRVHSVERHAAGFRLATAAGELLAERVVIATGGLSLPKSGSDGAGYAFARELGLATLPTYPALVPLTSPDARFGALAGISLGAELTAWRARAPRRELRGRAALHAPGIQRAGGARRLAPARGAVGGGHVAHRPLARSRRARLGGAASGAAARARSRASCASTCRGGSRSSWSSSPA